MTPTDVRFYQERDESPALSWLAQQPQKVREKFDFLFKLLEEKGSTLARPYASPLGQKIYELRVRHQQVNYRLLYFFGTDGAAVIAHGCTKENEVDPADIRRAVLRRDKFLGDPDSYTYCEPEEE